MAVKFLTRETLPEIQARLSAIGPEDRPEWGSLQPAALMRHLRYACELTTGKASTKDMSNILTRTVLRWLFFHVFTTWPKGKIKAPADFTPEPEGDLEAERAALFAEMDEFVRMAETEPDRKVAHPLLGPTPLSYWTRTHGLHFAHHLRQYGV